MTGFGHVEQSVGGASVAVDIKTVNGRFLDMNIRVPRELTTFEPEIRGEIQKRVSRGRVDLFVNLLRPGAAQDINEEALEAYLAVAAKLGARGVTGSLDVGTLLQLPSVTVERPLDYTSDEFASALRTSVRAALDQVLEGREIEGAALKRDLEQRIEALRRFVDTISRNSQSIRDHYLDKLRHRLADARVDQMLDENRLTQELIYYTERSDVSEETTRLQAHIDRFHQHLAQSGTENVGKQLDFLCQEMNREVNTILSKSPLAEVSQVGVDAKAEIEKMREQVQNVE